MSPFDLFYEIRWVGCADDGQFTVYGFMLQKHAPTRLRTQRSLSSCFGVRTSSSHLALAKCRRPQTVFPHKPINREPTTDTFRILLTKCGGWLPIRLSFTPLLLPASGIQAAPQGVPPQEAARPIGTHPSTAARIRHPDRTSWRPSAGGSPSDRYSPLHCCPHPAARLHLRGCELGGMRTACECVVV